MKIKNETEKENKHENTHENEMNINNIKNVKSR